VFAFWSGNQRIVSSLASTAKEETVTGTGGQIEADMEKDTALLEREREGEGEREAAVAGRVTRLGEISPCGRIVYSEQFQKST
jgi:hypothetical protein